VLPAIAAVATVVSAVGFGAAVNRTLSNSTPVPQLRAVSAGTLSGFGLRLGPAATAPYCGLQQGAAQLGWLPAGSLGCPISQSTAEAAAAQPLRGKAVESVLASVSSSQVQSLRGRVAWVVVVRQRFPLFPALPRNACGPTSGGGRAIAGAPCATPTRPSAANFVVVVDAHSAQRLAMFAVIGVAGGLWLPPPPVQVGGAN
jgi:hypothetical protein